MRKQPNITEATKQAFVDAFCELAATCPIDKITIQSLTKKAGYNRSTFYAYFNNMHELMEHIENEVIGFVEGNIFETIENAEAAEQFIAMFTEDMEAARAKYIDLLLTNPQNSGFALRLKEALLPAYMAQFRISDSDHFAKYVLDFHISGMIAVATRWMLNGRDIPIEKLGEVVRRVLTKGILDALKH